MLDNGDGASGDFCPLDYGVGSVSTFQLLPRSALWYDGFPSAPGRKRKDNCRIGC